MVDFPFKTMRFAFYAAWLVGQTLKKLKSNEIMMRRSPDNKYLACFPTNSFFIGPGQKSAWEFILQVKFDFRLILI